MSGQLFKFGNAGIILADGIVYHSFRLIIAFFVMLKYKVQRAIRQLPVATGEKLVDWAGKNNLAVKRLVLKINLSVF